jgi:glucosamine--fructose-6-phosphate aminotransferase (isomerizing)
VLTIAVVNNTRSTLARESDVVFDICAGVEGGIASTKGFSSSVLAFVLIALRLGKANGALPASEEACLISQLRTVPDLVQEVVHAQARSLDLLGTPACMFTKESEEDCPLWKAAYQNVLARNFLFLGRGFNFPIAIEGAVKCKEIGYIHAEGYPAAELKHGPIALIDQFMPVVFIAPKSDPTFQKIKANIEEVKARDGTIIVITDEEGTEELDSLCECMVHVPTTHEYFMPLLTIIPLQLLALTIGLLRGNEVDNPRGLVKSVRDSAER